MPWPVPAPGVISGRAAAVYEENLPGIDARSQNTVASVNCKIVEMAMLELYLYLAWLANETMPDTAVDNLPRFGTMWGIPQTQASAATGNVIFSGAAGVDVPQGVQLVLNGQTYSTAAAVAIGAGGTASVPVQAVVAGSAGNLAAGSVLTVVSATGLNIGTTATVDSNGLTGGADIESTTSWRNAILAEIREEPAGGDYADYEQWAKEALPNVALASCPAAACGGGVVSVAVAMTGLVAPTDAERATILAYIQARRPTGATEITVYACVLNPVNVTLALNPNTVDVQAAASAALALSFAQDAAIGATTYLSRLGAAVSSSDGEFSHELVAPAADVPAPSLFALNVLGTVTYQ